MSQPALESVGRVSDLLRMNDPDLTRYRQHLNAQGYARPTIRAKTEIVACVARAAGVAAADLRQQHVEAYFQRQLKPWSRKKYLQHLSCYGEWAGLESITRGLKLPRTPRPAPKPCTDNALAAMLEVTAGRNRAFIVFGAYAGMRSFEIAKIRGEDLEHTEVGWQLRIEGKGGREDVIPVGDLFVETFLACRATAGVGRLFPGCSASAVQMAIRRTAASVGLVVSAHQLRHWYGTKLYRLSRDLILVQQLMRHSSPKETIAYAALLADDGSRLVAQLPVPSLHQEQQT
ncbi:MAG: tyrosine-type recombinase/integrase [Frankiales bacterium]|nr:tyrosine-type recombinase/integrase [Frankiales bacterium]